MPNRLLSSKTHKIHRKPVARHVLYAELKPRAPHVSNQLKRAKQAKNWRQSGKNSEHFPSLALSRKHVLSDRIRLPRTDVTTQHSKSFNFPQLVK